MDQLPQESKNTKKSSFKKVIQNAIRSKRVIKTISFSLEERKVEIEKPHKKFVSPPPSVVIDIEEDSIESNNEEEEKAENETHKELETLPLKPAPLLHSASFFTVNKKVDVDCPQTPSRNRKENPSTTNPDNRDEGFLNYCVFNV